MDEFNGIEGAWRVCCHRQRITIAITITITTAIIIVTSPVSFRSGPNARESVELSALQCLAGGGGGGGDADGGGGGDGDGDGDGDDEVTRFFSLGDLKLHACGVSRLAPDVATIPLLLIFFSPVNAT